MGVCASSYTSVPGLFLQMRGSLAAWPSQGRVWQSTRGRVSPGPPAALPSQTWLSRGRESGVGVPGSSLIPQAGFHFSDVFLESSVVPLFLDTLVIVISEAVQIWELLPLVLESVTANSCETRCEIIQFQVWGSSNFYELVLFSTCHWMLSCLFLVSALLPVLMIYSSCQCCLSLFWQWWMHSFGKFSCFFIKNEFGLVDGARVQFSCQRVVARKPAVWPPWFCASMLGPLLARISREPLFATSWKAVQGHYAESKHCVIFTFEGGGLRFA